MVRQVRLQAARLPRSIFCEASNRCGSTRIGPRRLIMMKTFAEPGFHECISANPVQDDEQGRQRRVPCLPARRSACNRHACNCLGLAQHSGGAPSLPAGRSLHTVNQRELGLQVEIMASHVRQAVRYTGEGRATLEVDGHQVQLLGGGQSQRERGYATPRLTRMGRADQQAVSGPIPQVARIPLMSRTTAGPRAPPAKGGLLCTPLASHPLLPTAECLPMPTNSMRSFWRDSSERAPPASSSFPAAMGVMRTSHSACTAC